MLRSSSCEEINVPKTVGLNTYSPKCEAVKYLKFSKKRTLSVPWHGEKWMREDTLSRHFGDP